MFSANGEAGLKDGKAHIYGEPAPATTDLMLRRMGAGEKDVLYDLGCGRGFFLMQALLTTPLRRAVGVELAASRVAIGRTAQRMMTGQGLLSPMSWSPKFGTEIISYRRTAEPAG